MLEDISVMAPNVEICVDNLESVKAAHDCHVKRIELCSSLKVSQKKFEFLIELILIFLGWWSYSKLWFF